MHGNQGLFYKPGKISAKMPKKEAASIGPKDHVFTGTTVK